MGGAVTLQDFDWPRLWPKSRNWPLRRVQLSRKRAPTSAAASTSDDTLVTRVSTPAPRRTLSAKLAAPTSSATRADQPIDAERRATQRKL